MKRVVMIPMRDGVKLYTVIVIPKGATHAPILLRRARPITRRNAMSIFSPYMLDIMPKATMSSLQGGIHSCVAGCAGANTVRGASM